MSYNIIILHDFSHPLCLGAYKSQPSPTYLHNFIIKMVCVLIVCLIFFNSA